MDPGEAVLTHVALHSSQSIAIHFGAFHLSQEGFDEPITDLKAALRQHGVPEGRFFVLPVGQTIEEPERSNP
jgi:hypothetical protein